MAKFDVYLLRDDLSYVLECQADLLSDLSTRFVVPLLSIEEAPTPAARLNPVFEILDNRYVMVTQFAATIPAFELKTKITSLRDQDFQIGNALDMLISGY